MNGLYLFVGVVAFAAVFVVAVHGHLGGRLERITCKMANWWAI